MKRKRNSCEAIINRVEGGLCLCAEGERTVLSSGGSLLSQIQDIFHIDLGYRIPAGEQRVRQSDSRKCSYCNSINTIGHGTRETQTEKHQRRLCNTCKRTYISGKQYTDANTDTKEDDCDVIGKISFLTFCGYNSIEVAEDLHISLPIVTRYLNEVANDYLKNLIRIIPAEPFDKKTVPKKYIGSTILWSKDEKYCIGRKGCTEEVYLNKGDTELIRKFSNKETELYLRGFSQEQQSILLGYIEDMIDYDLGYFPTLKTDTKVMPDAGELDLELFETGQQAATIECEK